jgi:hypothetical protein
MTEGLDSSSPDGVKNFLFFTSSKPVTGPTQPPIQWVPGALSPEVTRPGREAGHSPSLVPRSRMVELHLHSSTCLHSTGATSLC